ncbi:MAG: hypothetical protein J6Y91_05315 [Alphaproteobacteria bacterium]|nr:hypothetical protein [Alphaproteobacteria bacterium]
MKFKWKNIIISLLIIAVLVCIANTGFAADSCSKALNSKNVPAINPTSPSGGGMIDTGILNKMQQLMLIVYQTLAQILMFGHSLVCYAQTHYLGATYHKLVNLWFTSIGIWIWDFSMLICGCIVYVVGLFLSIAVGMYFVDVSFKIGFAVLMMPVSIALWPFKPTSQKFTDNFFIIVRNAMLFAFVAITVAFATELIAQGVGLDEYWALVEQGTESTAVHEVKSLYSLFTVKFLVIAFCLIFGFRIMSSSVDKYLDFFFQDPVFGSESPMHHMGTQAVGMATDTLLKPAGSYIKDVASNMAGKSMIGIGNSLGRMKEGDFSDFKKIGHAMKTTGSVVAHPVRSTRRAAGAIADSTVEAAGSVAKELHDWKMLLKPGSFYEQEYREKQKSFDDKVDNYVHQGAKEATKQAISGGIASAINGGQILHDAYKNAKAPGSAKDKAKATYHALKGENIDRVSSDDVRAELHGAHMVANTVMNEAKDAVVSGAEKIADGAENMAKNGIAASISGAGKMAAMAQGMDPSAVPDTQMTRQMLHNGKMQAKKFIVKKKRAAQKTANTVNNAVRDTGSKIGAKVTPGAKKFAEAVNPNKTSISLQPSALIAAPFKLAHGIGNTITTLAKMQMKGLDVSDPNRLEAMKQMAKDSVLYQAGSKVAQSAGSFGSQVADSYNQTYGDIGMKATMGGLKAGELIMKKSGQIVVRTAKGTAQDTLGILSRVFIGVGKELSDNKRKSGSDYRRQRREEEREKLEQEKEAAIFNRSLADKYDD